MVRGRGTEMELLGFFWLGGMTCVAIRSCEQGAIATVNSDDSRKQSIPTT